MERHLQDREDYTPTDDDKFAERFNAPVVSDPEIPEVDDTFTPDTIGDEYLNIEVVLNRGANDESDFQFGKVTKRLRDAEGRPIGTANENPILDTRQYAVEFRDGRSELLSANHIAQNLYSQIDMKDNVICC